MTYLAWYREIVLKLPRQNLLCVVWRKDIELQSSSSSISSTEKFSIVRCTGKRGIMTTEYTVGWNCLWRYAFFGGVFSLGKICMHCKCFVCWNHRWMPANQIQRQLGVILTDLICNQIILFPCYFYRHLFVVLGVLCITFHNFVI